MPPVPVHNSVSEWFRRWRSPLRKFLVGRGVARVADLNCVSIDFAGFFEFRHIVDEGGMNYTVTLGSAALETAEVLDIAAMNLCSQSAQCFGGSFGASQTNDVIALRIYF